MSIEGSSRRRTRIAPLTLRTNNEPVKPVQTKQSQIFKVIGSVYVSDYASAKDEALLSSYSITHILNLAGEDKCPNLFPSTIQYFSLKMPDNAKIDILFFLYFAVEFIQNSIESNGKVLIHCVKGSSRAAAVSLAYLILQGYSEAEAYTVLSRSHPSIDPNLGFMCQLKELQQQNQEKRIFTYSAKYEMFTNVPSSSALSIEISSQQCTVYFPTDSPCSELALKSARLWEKFNKSTATLVHIN